MKTEPFAPGDIVIGDRMRAVDDAAVDRLAESIRQIGLQTPITVRWVNDADGEVEPVLVAGRHRLAACVKLGLVTVQCCVLDGSEIDARLWEIAENLHRADLSVQERSDHIAEWIKLSADKLCQDETVSKGGRGQQGGIRAAARELGVGHSEAARAVKISSISPGARQAADDAGLNTQAARLEIASAPADQQTAKVAELKRRVEDRKLVQSAGDDIVQRDGADDFAQMVIDFFPEHRITEALGYLDASGATRVSKAIRRAIKTGDRIGSDKPVFDQSRFGHA